MSTTVTRPTFTPTSETATERRPVWKHGVAAAVGSSLVTTALAAVASAAGVSFADHTGAAIPITAFAQLTLFFSLVGIGLAAVFARKAKRPQSTFVWTTVALAVL